MTNKPRGVQRVVVLTDRKVDVKFSYDEMKHTVYTEKGLKAISSSHNNVALSFP